MTIEVTDAGRNEYEALVRDAKRYRALRAAVGRLDVSVQWNAGRYRLPPNTGTMLDIAIDAYKKRQEEAK